ncbi:MAG: hypothetical protein KYX68_00370 [Flavobacterium sp.]|nr:hypothetical protein [Flavobacterium sp.]
MKYFYKLLDFYIESSLHVAFAVYALIRITFLKLNLAYDEPVAYFGFYGTIVGYNFIKYDELVRVRRVALSKRFKAIIGLSFICFWITLYYFWQLETITKLLGIGALFLTVLYTIPFIPNKSNMRNWSGIKIYLVAVAWVAVTVWLPVINAHYPIDILVVLKSLQRFILVFVLMLIFEIVDLQFDGLYLKTIPQQLGEKKTKILAYLLLVVFILLDFLKPDFTLKVFLINLVFTLILGVFTYFTSKKRNKYYTSFWVEALPIVWLLLLI